jgi:superfamily II DNA or RNA helicase
MEVNLDDVAMFGAGQKELGTVTVAMAQSLVKAIKKKPDLLKGFKVIFSDECHHLPSDTLEAIFNRCPAQYRFGLSGTAFDGNPVRDYRLMAATGPIIADVRNKELIDRGVSAKPKVFFLKSKAKELKDDLTYQEAVKEGIVYNEERNRQILHLVQDLLGQGKKAVLVLSPRKMHGLQLFSLMQSESIDVTFNHGSTPDAIRKQSLRNFRDEGGVMIGSTIYDEGIDVPAIEALILAGGGKSKRQLLQRIGRALRRKKEENVVEIYDFYDWHHSYLARHSAQRLKTHYKEEFEVEYPKELLTWVNKVMKPKREKQPKPKSAPRVRKPLLAENTLRSKLKKIRSTNNGAI